MSIGERIKTVRKQKGLTQKELANKLGVSQQMINQYEKSTNGLRVDTVKKIAIALNVPYTDLIDFEDQFTNHLRDLNKFVANAEQATQEEYENIVEKSSDFLELLETLDNDQLAKNRTFKEKSKELYNLISSLKNITVESNQINEILPDDELKIIMFKLKSINFDLFKDLKTNNFLIGTPDNEIYGYFSKEDLIKFNENLKEYEIFQVNLLIKKARLLEK